ncbi:golgin subfamily A member 4 isoform X2 [Tachyglossus aculeatus]|uniref:golgin subfamily A member 4 isoform X2 n=1 Tax=Tachyglossus aculeatus TaxID=9261 RepID=UPI0018F6FBC6|nr:golgin subfamily A member 4 isoform X2 [Tachyglossus aculeatus]
MFKKLKQKISEEQQSPLPPPSAQVSPSPSTPSQTRSRTSSLVEQSDEGPPDRELLARMIAEPAFLSEYTIFALDPSKPAKPPSDRSANAVTLSSLKAADRVHVNGPSPTQPTDTQTFAQKLQLRVPSLESLFRSPVKQSLFRAPSKEFLARASSRDSLNQLDLDASTSTFDPPSDIESEAEDAMGNVDSLTEDQLLWRLNKSERCINTYREKYSELFSAYQASQREKKKLQSILGQSQDKALQRIGELREEIQMGQQAKKHLQDEMDASLEEKDQLISVLQTQVSLLKQRLMNGQKFFDSSASESQDESQTSSTVEETSPRHDLESGNVDRDSVDIETLQQRVRRQENLLKRCKEMIQSHKERSTLLSNEKEALQEQLEERLQELEKMKELQMVEKTKLITQLRDAKNLIEQLEQDKGMIIAETKRQMHETLELKEEEIVQLRSRIKQITLQGEKLQEQKEKSEKAAFEELEKALSTAQRTEEARKKLKAEMDEQIKAIEKTSEEERVNLQQELSRVKQEAIDIMKKTSEDRIAQLQNLHVQELVKKEQDLNEKFQAREKELQEQMKAVLEKSQIEHLKTAQEKEQQGSLALEELELQKKAIISESENKLQNLRQEAETYRTRILELESSLAKYSQNSENQSAELTSQIEAAKSQHNEEITALTENHKAELEILQEQLAHQWTEKLRVLKEQHEAGVEQLREKHERECDALLREKETTFHAHIEEMNDRMLEKLDVKQTELEVLSSDLAEALKVRLRLEQELSSLQSEAEAVKQEQQLKLKEEKARHQEQVDSALKEREISSQKVEKALKDEINQLCLQLKAKDDDLAEQRERGRKLEESSREAEAEVKRLSAALDGVQSQHDNSSQRVKAYEDQLAELRSKLSAAEAEGSQLKAQAVETKFQQKEGRAELDSYKIQVQELTRQLEVLRDETDKKVASITELYEARSKDVSKEQEEMRRRLAERENEIVQMKAFQVKEIEDLQQKLLAKEESIGTLQGEYESKLKNQETKMEKLKQKAKEMQETFKKKLSEQEAKLKKELENTHLELSQKEKQFNSKMLEMAHASSAGINEAVSKLERNQKEQLENLAETHQRELTEVRLTWEGKLSQKVEEFREERELERREKEQEIVELKEQLLAFGSEKEGAGKELMRLKEEGAKRDSFLNEVQEQLKEASAQVRVLSQSETGLRAQLEELERVLSQSQSEKTLLQDRLAELRDLEEDTKTRASNLSDELKSSDERLKALGAACEEYERKLEGKNLEFRKATEELAAQLGVCCEKTEAFFHAETEKLLAESNAKVEAVLSRLAVCQCRVSKAKEVLLARAGQVPKLEAQLRRVTEEQAAASDTLRRSTEQLQEKESQIVSLRADIKCLATENEALREGGHQQRTASEKEACIAQLSTDLSTHIDAVSSARGELEEKKSEVASLNRLVSELQLQNRTNLAEKEAAVALLSEQHREDRLALLSQVEDLVLKVDTLNREKASALEQVDSWSTQVTELKGKAQATCVQSEGTVKELEKQLELKNRETDEKDKQLSLLKEDLSKQSKQLESLKSEMEEQNQRETRERDLATHLATQTARIAELEEWVAKKTAENEHLMEDLKRHNHPQVIQQQEGVQELQHTQEGKQDRLKGAKEKILRLEKQVDSMEAELEAKQRDFDSVKDLSGKSQEEALKALEERLNVENAAKLADLKKKAEQKIAAIKKQLRSQMEKKEQQYKKETESQLEEMNQKVREREREIQTLQESLRANESSLAFEKVVVPKEMKHVKASRGQKETGAPNSDLHMYEEKIHLLQRDLAAKDKLLQKLEREKEEEDMAQLGMHSQRQELFLELENPEKQQQVESVGLRNELEEWSKKYVLFSTQNAEEDGVGNSRAGEQPVVDSLMTIIQKALQEKEQNHKFMEQKIKELNDRLVGEKEARRLEVEEWTWRCEKSQAPQKPCDIKTNAPEIVPESAQEIGKAEVELRGVLSSFGEQQKELQLKLEDAEREKQKLQKEKNQLQKDLRALRKVHQQELEMMKKESEKELEETIKTEQEDLELKHNSTVKQLMREFNTQLAQKEHEMEATIKETISKAQEVEAELLETHQEETKQLRKRILEKEDDLKRTARKYEDILEAREEELTAKVVELQNQLEELHKEYQNLHDKGNQSGDDVTVMELQTQLAQKTTLVNDSKLKEQEYREQIHTLEDRLKRYEKNIYVTATVGTPYQDGNLCHTAVTQFGEPTEFEYLRKVMFEYMMGNETKTLAKVITTVLKFPADQAQKVLEREDARPRSWLQF